MRRGPGAGALPATPCRAPQPGPERARSRRRGWDDTMLDGLLWAADGGLPGAEPPAPAGWVRAVAEVGLQRSRLRAPSSRVRPETHCGGADRAEGERCRRARVHSAAPVVVGVAECPNANSVHRPERACPMRAGLRDARGLGRAIPSSDGRHGPDRRLRAWTPRSMPWAEEYSLELTAAPWAPWRRATHHYRAPDALGARPGGCGPVKPPCAKGAAWPRTRGSSSACSGGGTLDGVPLATGAGISRCPGTTGPDGTVPGDLSGTGSPGASC